MSSAVCAPLTQADFSMIGSPPLDASSAQSPAKDKKRDASVLSTEVTEHGSSVVSSGSEEAGGIPAKKSLGVDCIRAEGTKPLRVVIDGMNVAQCRERDLPTHDIDDARAVSRAFFISTHN